MLSLPHPSPATHQPLAASQLATQASAPRAKRDAPAPPATADTSRAAGDRQLAMEYRSALLHSASGATQVRISPIPAHSTFGQWWGQLREAFQSPDVSQWIRDKGIDPTSITLDPESGQVLYSLKLGLDPKKELRVSGQDDSQWAAISGPILKAARAIGVNTPFVPPATHVDVPVPWSIVGRFYQEPQGLDPAAMRERAERINQDQGFKPLDPTTSQALITSRSEGALQDQKAVLGDIYNRHAAAFHLQDLATSLEGGHQDPDKIRKGLGKRVDLSSDGTYQPGVAGEASQVTLLQFLQDHGWDIPTTPEELLNLATTLSTPTPRAPAHGNLGGALSWPEPLDLDNQEQLRQYLRSAGNPLDHLLGARTLSPADLRNPRELLNTLINSPLGLAMGEALQAKFEARSVKGTATDWLLAALTVASTPSAENNGKIEGYRLLSPANAGLSPSAVVKTLAEHLAATGRASTAQTASVQAQLMLASRAPEFLVKDIPDPVRVGTHSWVSFATAVARIEAKAPGATASMSYAQVMLHASLAPISDDERQVEYAAQDHAIKDWAVANGWSYPTSQAAISEVRNAFNTQVSELRDAAQTQVGQLPTTKGIALEQLKKALPDMDPKLFEKQAITLDPSHRNYPGPYSILDLFIDGKMLHGTPDSADDWGTFGRGFVDGATFGLVKVPKDGLATHWVSASNAINIAEVLAKIKDLPRPQPVFDKAFADYSKAVTKTTSAQIKYLISKLPPEDRLNLEFAGKIRKEVEYFRDDQPLRVAEGVLFVDTERNGNPITYVIDRIAGTITTQASKKYEEYDPRFGTVPSKGKRYDVVNPEGLRKRGAVDERKAAQEAADSFGSRGVRYIVDSVLEDMDLPGAHRYAKGETTFDTQVPTYKILKEVALNLIPLRSAIANFKQGNVTDGFVDLAFDVFGFAVGLGTAVKGAKGFSAGASALSKSFGVGKILGRATVGVLNPLSGFDDLARGAWKGVRTAGGAVYNKLKPLGSTYRNVDLLALAKSPDIAEGTYKAAHGSGEINTLAKFDDESGKWFAYNPTTKNAYGKSIEDFKPQTLADIKNAASEILDTTLLGKGLANDNVIQLGSKMKDFKVIDSGVHTFADTYKGSRRLNIVAHGDPYVSNKKFFSRNNATMTIDNKSYSADELVEMLKAKGVNPKDYDSVRLLMCHSAEGGTHSFGAQLQKVVKKPVKAFEGTVTSNFDPAVVTYLHNKGVAGLKAQLPGIPDPYAHMLAADHLRNQYVNKIKPRVEKNHGGTIQINIGDIGGKPKLVTAPINYQPKKFGTVI